MDRIYERELKKTLKLPRGKAALKKTKDPNDPENFTPLDKEVQKTYVNDLKKRRTYMKKHGRKGADTRSLKLNRESFFEKYGGKPK